MATERFSYMRQKMDYKAQSFCSSTPKITVPMKNKKRNGFGESWNSIGKRSISTLEPSRLFFLMNGEILSKGKSCEFIRTFKRCCDARVLNSRSRFLTFLALFSILSARTFYFALRSSWCPLKNLKEEWTWSRHYLHCCFLVFSSTKRTPLFKDMWD